MECQFLSEFYTTPFKIFLTLRYKNFVPNAQTAADNRNGYVTSTCTLAKQKMTALFY